MLVGCSTSTQNTLDAYRSGESTPTPISAASTTTAPGATNDGTASTPAPATTPEQAIANSPKTLALLETLPIKGRAPKTGYTRSQFGQAWTDDVDVAGGHNGCDTRNDILRRDLTNVAFRSGSNCVVAGGVLHDVYTAKTIDFTRGQTTSTAVQIDHMVALSNAWQTGAQALSVQQRTNLANDPLNLQAVDGPTNEAKGDGDAATWLPPNKTYRCTYVTRQVEVKAKYHLWVTQAEHDAIAGLLKNCNAPVNAPQTAVPAPPPQTPRTQAPRTQAPPPPAPHTQAPPPPPPPAANPGTSAYYPNCAAARAAGVAPIYRGQPGYSSKLDRDGDGVACE